MTPPHAHIMHTARTQPLTNHATHPSTRWAPAYAFLLADPAAWAGGALFACPAPGVSASLGMVASATAALEVAPLRASLQPSPLTPHPPPLTPPTRTPTPTPTPTPHPSPLTHSTFTLTPTPTLTLTLIRSPRCARVSLLRTSRCT